MFPSSVGHVLGDAAARFEARDGELRVQHPRAVAARFPVDASGDVHILSPDGVELRVREHGATGQPHLVHGGAAVVLTGEHGTSFWSATPAGLEEWLWLDSVPPDGRVATWTVAGARPQALDGAVQLVDGSGRPIFLVRAPTATTRSGRALSPTLSVSGAEVSVFVEPTGEPVLIDPSWSVANGVLNRPRYEHTATLLWNGQVLIAGGSVTGSMLDELNNAELYDPTTGTSTAIQPLKTVRRRHSAARLQDGRLLVMGGQSTLAGTTASAELFDLTTGSWTNAQPMMTGRYYFNASVMSDGQVLVVGGQGLRQCEIYDPDAGTWSPTGLLNDPHISAAMAPVGRDNYLVASGLPDGGGSSESYDRSTGSWALTPNGTQNSFASVNLMTPLADGGIVATTNGTEIRFYSVTTRTWTSNPIDWTVYRDRACQVRLRDGRVLAFGGGTIFTKEVDALNPSDGTFADGGTLAYFHYDGVGVMMPSGRVNVFGGNDQTTSTPQIEISDDATPSWSTAQPAATPRADAAAVTLPDGTLFVAGGRSGATLSTALASAERYQPSIGSWLPAGALSVARSGATATLLPDGKVLVAGGWLANGAASSAVDLYDPATKTWSPTGSMSVGHAWHAAVLLAGGKVLVVGGGTGSSQRVVEEYNPGSGLWARLPDLAQLRARPKAVLLKNNRVLVVGGGAAPAEEYDPVAETWTTVGALSVARDQPAATLLPSGFVLVSGGTVAGAPVATSELYNPATQMFGAPLPMAAPRAGHVQVVLRSGLVLASGGDAQGTAEQYDPETTTWRATVAAPFAAQAAAGALLLNGTVVIAGGDVSGAPAASAAAFDEGRGTLLELTPVVSAVPLTAAVGSTISLSGSGFFPPDSSSGWFNASPSNFPLVFFSRWQGGQTVPARVTGFTDSSASVVVPASLPAGWYALGVVVNGVQAAATSILLTRPGATGDACLSAGDCSGGVCAGFVCCSSPCASTCNSCSRDTGALHDGTCQQSPMGAVCRPADGGCDLPEYCPGAGAPCPADLIADAGVPCRPAAGACDVAEICSGSSASCPADVVVDAGVLCRPADAGCDVAELCSGTSGVCPPDGFASASDVCRVAVDPCDVAETCSGNSRDCPLDAARPDGTSCSDAVFCNGAEVCRGGACQVGPPVECALGEVCVEAAQGCLGNSRRDLHAGCGCGASPFAGGWGIAAAAVARQLRSRARERKSQARASG
jgi:hypothetical protein